MNFADSYNATVLALLQARNADTSTPLTTFLGQQKSLIDDLMERWTDRAEDLPSPEKVLALLMSIPMG